MSNYKQCREVQIDSVVELPRNFDFEEAVASSKSDAKDYCPQHDNRIALSKQNKIFYHFIHIITVCLTHQNGQCYQCAFEKLCGGKNKILTCKTMKKTEYDRKVAEKTSEIQEKIDVVFAHIIDKQNSYIEFIKVTLSRRT